MRTKFLVPVDFTKTSFSAYHYANQLAHHCKGEITLLHIIHGSLATSETQFLDTLDIAMKAAIGRLKYFSQKYPSELGYSLHKVKTNREVRFGVPGYTVTDYAHDNHYDYIIAGTRDNHSILDKALGTTSHTLAKTSKVPLLFIHENTHFVKPEKIVFALDNIEDFDESIPDFVQFNKHFGASVVFVHVKADAETKNKAVNTLINEILKEKNPGFSFEVKTINGGDTIQSVIDFTIFEKADMLALVHRKKSLFQKMLTRSVSIKAIDKIHLPILWLTEQTGSGNT